MSVPLDRLYNFLHDVCNHDDVVIYRFFPHGSRKITDLLPLNPKRLHRMGLDKCAIFHDQEPLNFELYNNVDMFDELLDKSESYQQLKQMLTDDLYVKRKEFLSTMISRINLRLAISPGEMNVPTVLVHSEARSKNLQRYQEQGFADCYWWCHGLIARDWFRYAEHDPLLAVRNPSKDFLIYNRAWSGTREYRLKFTELIVDNNLQHLCQMGFTPVDSVHYCDHAFVNPAFGVFRNDLEQHFLLNNTDSTASADYVSLDYQTTEVEVVLETLFDDDRLHLTEKILRPIACGHPFMLVATHGSLEYLRSYGFETFDQLIDESYDAIEDPAERLQAIVREMKRIAALPTDIKVQLYKQMRTVAKRNQQLFFSKAWENKIVDEFKTNIDQAVGQLSSRLQQTFKRP